MCSEAQGQLMDVIKALRVKRKSWSKFSKVSSSYKINRPVCRVLFVVLNNNCMREYVYQHEAKALKFTLEEKMVNIT